MDSFDRTFRIGPGFRQAELINFGINGPSVLMQSRRPYTWKRSPEVETEKRRITLPPIVMEVENEVLEDVFSLQMRNFHFHVYGGKGSSCLSQNLEYRKSQKNRENW